jgi:hypothetical protein
MNTDIANVAATGLAMYARAHSIIAVVASSVVALVLFVMGGRLLVDPRKGRILARVVTVDCIDSQNQCFLSVSLSQAIESGLQSLAQVRWDLEDANEQRPRVGDLVEVRYDPTRPATDASRTGREPLRGSILISVGVLVFVVPLIFSILIFRSRSLATVAGGFEATRALFSRGNTFFF